MQTVPSPTTVGRIPDANSGTESMSFCVEEIIGSVGTSTVPETSEVLFNAERLTCRFLAHVMSVSREEAHKNKEKSAEK